MRPVYRIAFALILAATSLPAAAAEPDAPSALITPTEAVRIAIQQRLSAKFTRASEAQKSQQGALVEYYSVPDQKLLWVDENGLTDRGKAVMEEIARADDYGLRAADYELPKSDGFHAGDASATAWLADAEVKISLAALRYSRDARGGRIDPSQLTDNLDPTLALPNPLEVLDSIAIRADAAAYLRSFQPDQPQFEALRHMLIELRGGKETPKVDQIPDGPVLKKGMEDDQVVLLRKRLEVASGADGATVNEKLYDDAVEAAVKEFQRSRGVAADGLVGAGTRRLLNQQQHHEAANPAKIRLILLNMERWRWLPHDLGSFYVNVNVPEFMLRVVEDAKVVHTARVVVGKTDKQTPIFSQDMQEVVFNPYWNVPNSIKTEEIRPYLRDEGGWFFGGGGGWNTRIFDAHNLRINIGGREVDPASIDWNRVDIRALNIYQPPGPDNVLGSVKFVFPNKHDVYMHDTTQKFLFAKQVRAESHGCMRVQNPDQLAAILLKHDQGWSQGRVASAIAGGADQHVALRQKIPVYITYFTAWVNENGALSTFSDLYGHDARMASALRLGGPPPPPDEDAILFGGGGSRREAWGLDPN
jgi:murein L,D-transpeptidase YcbB/YkuD